jgi:hypothetical protein
MVGLDAPDGSPPGCADDQVFGHFRSIEASEFGQLEFESLQRSRSSLTKFCHIIQMYDNVQNHKLAKTSDA